MIRSIFMARFSVGAICTASFSEFGEATYVKSGKVIAARSATFGFTLCRRVLQPESAEVDCARKSRLNFALIHPLVKIMGGVGEISESTFNVSLGHNLLVRGRCAGWEIQRVFPATFIESILYRLILRLEEATYIHFREERGLSLPLPTWLSGFRYVALF